MLLSAKQPQSFPAKGKGSFLLDLMLWVAQVGLRTTKPRAQSNKTRDSGNLWFISASTTALLLCLEHWFHLTQLNTMSHPLALHGAPQWAVSSAGSRIVFSHSAAPLLPTAGPPVLWKPFGPCSGQVGHERIPSCVQREENKVMGQRVKVNKKILFSYTRGMFLTQIKHPTCRRKTVQKYHTEEIWMACHHWGVTRQVPLEAQTVLPTLNHMAGWVRRSLNTPWILSSSWNTWDK